MAQVLPILMFVSLVGLMFTSYPVAFILGGLAILFGVVGWTLDVFELVEFFNIVARTWFIAENLAIIAVPCFIFMGVMLERSNIATDLLETLQELLARVPGGMALAVTVMSTIMAAITGIIGASVVTMTLIALPTMLRHGYSPALASGTIAASSTLGILIPPSILLVFMSDMLGISEGILFGAALFPGLLLSGLYLLFIVCYATAVPGVAPPRRERGAGDGDWRAMAAMCMKGFVPPAALIAMVLGAILTGFTTVTESAAVGAIGAIVLAAVRGRLSRRVLDESLQRAALMIGMVFFMFIGATGFAYVFRVLGGDELILGMIETSAMGSWGTLIVLMAMVFVMGFFFDVLEILLIVIPIFAPIVEALDFGAHIPRVDVIYWFAMLIAVNLQTSFLTPPMGLALFYMKGVAPDTVSMGQIYRGVVPFVILQLICVGLVMAYPGIAMWLPHTIFD